MEKVEGIQLGISTVQASHTPLEYSQTVTPVRERLAGWLAGWSMDGLTKLIFF